MAGTKDAGGFDQEQVRNAQTIIAVGRRLGASQRDIQIALMTALVESNLHNVNYGDRDSLGLFQQRASWGSKAERMDPVRAAEMFFKGGSAADGYSEPGLFDKKNRDSMSMGQAAQAVQVSAYPDRYAERQSEAARLMQHFGDTKGVPGTLGGVPGYSETDPGPSISEALQGTLGDFPGNQPDIPEVNGLGEVTNDALASTDTAALGTTASAALAAPTFDGPQPQTDPLADMKIPSLQDMGIEWQGADDFANGEGWRHRVADVARKFLGTPYVWGGTSPSGFDCSGLVQYVYKQLGFDLPRISADQARSGKRIDLKDLKPGDLVGWDNSSRNYGADHIAIYIGDGKIIEAPRPGESVQISHIYDQGEAWGVRMHR